MLAQDIAVSEQIERLLVAKNLRGMASIKSHLKSGYYARAAQHLNEATGCIIIGTGFPVVDTFETDGPVGAIALYQVLKKLGKLPVLACGEPLVGKLQDDFDVLPLPLFNEPALDIASVLGDYQPTLIVSIERPGLAADGSYRNMRGEDISDRCAVFDHLFTAASCSTIAIGDGGNEIGMGNVSQALASLSIIPSVTKCDELLVADVSNWGAYGLIGFLAKWHKHDFLADIEPLEILEYLSKKGSVDGVTRENSLTEDSLTACQGQQVINEIRDICGFKR